MFFAAAGFRDFNGYDANIRDYNGSYWSSSLSDADDAYVRALDFSSSRVLVGGRLRADGNSVRCVQE